MTEQELAAIRALLDDANAWHCDHECQRETVERLLAEVERLREIGQHGCDCSTDDACLFARQRDEARKEVERLLAAMEAADE